MLFQSLFISPLWFNLSKPTTLFEILNRYCLLTSSSFSFLYLNLSTWNFCAARLHAANFSLNFATTRQWTVSQSAHVKDRTSSMLERRLSINIWSIRLWLFLPGQVEVYLWMFWCWNIVLLTTRSFDLTSFTIPTKSLISQCWLSVTERELCAELHVLPVLHF